MASIEQLELEMKALKVFGVLMSALIFLWFVMIVMR